MNLKKLSATAMSILLTSTLALAQTGELIFSYDFESSKDGWSGRQNEKVELTGDAAHSGIQCLKVSNRQASWNGGMVKSDGLKAGHSYHFECYIMYYSSKHKSHKHQLCASYDLGGSTVYVDLREITCKSGFWYKVYSTISFPNGATNLCIYVQSEYKESNETDNDKLDIYIDDAVCYEDTTVVPVEKVNPDSITSLKDYYSKYFKIGTSVSTYEIYRENAQKHIKKHCNSITCENEMKPDALLDQKKSQEAGKVCVTISDNTKAIMDFCVENDIAFRGHTLNWHSQTPEWFFKKNFSDNGAQVGKEEMSIRLEQYIQAVFEAISSTCPTLKLYAFDVVNEAFDNDGGGIRNSGWFTSKWPVIFGGESFMDSAFTYARKYAPKNCKLYYNDYNEYIPQKTDDIYNLVKRLYDNGVCDGVGMQSHLDCSYPTVDDVRTAIEKFLTIGDNIDLQVTELDITIKNNYTDKDQAALYKELFDLYVEHADHISSVTLWGTSDGVSWRKENNQRPLLFDDSYSPKLSYFAVVNEEAPEYLTIEPEKIPNPDPEPDAIGKLGNGINDNAIQELTVYGKAGAIVIETADGTKTDACIYQIDGRMVGRYTIDGRAEISMPSGIYIVDKQKVVVM